MLHCISQSNENKRLSVSIIEPAASQGASGKLGRILGYIHAHLGPELTQHEVAKEAGLSPAAFSQFFRRSLGTSYVHYVNELKVRNACRALMETTNPITEVALDAGFNNLSHFNAQFRRFRKVSPREFRLQAQRAEKGTPPAEPESAAEVKTRDLTVHGKGYQFRRGARRDRGSAAMAEEVCGVPGLRALRDLACGHRRSACTLPDCPNEPNDQLFSGVCQRAREGDGGWSLARHPARSGMPAAGTRAQRIRSRPG